MATNCSCNEILSTRLSKSDVRQGVTTVKGYIKTFADDNTKNVIDLTVPLTQSVFEAMLYNADPSKRLHLVKEIKNNAPEVSDETFETVGDGQEYKVNGGGVKLVQYDVFASEIYGEKVNPLFCGDYSEFEFDLCGNVWGVLSSDGLSLEPRPIHKESGNIKPVAATDAAVSRLSIRYQIKTTSNLLNNKGVVPTDVNINDLFSIEDVNATFDTITTAGANVTLTGDFGYSGAEDKVVGIAVGEVTVLVKATGVPVPLTSFTAGTSPNDNVYAMVTTGAMAAATEHTLSVLSNGFEVQATTFTTP